MPALGAVRLQRLVGRAPTSRGEKFFRQPIDQILLKMGPGEEDPEEVVAMIGRFKGAGINFIISNMGDEDRQKVLDQVIELRKKEMEANPNAPDIMPSDRLTPALPNADELEEVFEMLDERHEQRRPIHEAENEGRSKDLDDEREPGE